MGLEQWGASEQYYKIASGYTTTHRELFLLPDSGMVIDTPGMRELGMWKAGEGIEHTFSDVLLEKSKEIQP